jgi:gluconate 2-dehydrogenase gamma chain
MTAMQAPTDLQGAAKALAFLKKLNMTAPTRRALQERLMRPPVAQPRYFNQTEFKLLQSVCARLLAHTTCETTIDVAGAIDTRLADGEGNGWRYADLPPDAAAHRLGLQGIDEAAQAQFQLDFVQLKTAQQDVVLLAIQRGEVDGGVWRTVRAQRIFENLLAGAAEAYYAHPLAQQEIDCVAMADADGWHAVGLNDHQDSSVSMRATPLARGDLGE